MSLIPSDLDGGAEQIDAIRAVVLDYLFGYVEGDVERHSLAYHHEALKRRYFTDEGGVDVLDTVSPQMMLDWVASGRSITEGTEYELFIDDISEGMASVRVYSTLWIDYLHIVQARGKWRILHATWKHQNEQTRETNS